MSAPLRNSSSVVARLSSRLNPSAGTAISADAPPDSRTSNCTASVFGSSASSKRQGTTSGPLASSRRHRMVAAHDVERRRRGRVGCGDHQAAPHAVAEPAHRPGGHEGCRLANGQQPKRSVERWMIGQCGIDEG